MADPGKGAKCMHYQVGIVEEMVCYCFKNLCNQNPKLFRVRIVFLPGKPSEHLGFRSKIARIVLNSAAIRSRAFRPHFSTVKIPVNGAIFMSGPYRAQLAFNLTGI